MAQASPNPQSPMSGAKRPKGILKNSASYQHSPSDAAVSPPLEQAISPSQDVPMDGTARPSMRPREMSEKEITQMNTDFNAGGHRRNSSNPRGNISRRQSSQTGPSGQADGEHDESAARLKWDEANLYLNEGEMGGRMKITEPKTPYAKNYDPAEDEEEISTINAEELAVDELDMEKSRSGPRKSSGARSTTSDIPGLDLGEPEMDNTSRRESNGERKAQVDPTYQPEDTGHHGEKEEDMTSEELDKHKKFEEMRKKHYEMKNIKDLLGHSDQLDALDDDDEK